MEKPRPPAPPSGAVPWIGFTRGSLALPWGHSAYSVWVGRPRWVWPLQMCTRCNSCVLGSRLPWFALSWVKGLI